MGAEILNQFQLLPVAVPLLLAFLAMLVITGLVCFFGRASGGRILSFCKLREDRRIFLTSVALFTLISLVAGLTALGIVGRYAMVNFQDAFWSSYRSTSELFRTSVTTAVARVNEIAGLSQLNSLAAQNAAAADLQSELERIVRLANYEEITTLRIVNAHGDVLAGTGSEHGNDHFEVQLPLSLPTSLYWNDGWHLRIQVPIGSEAVQAGTLVVGVALPAFDQQYALVDRLGSSGETRICVADGGQMHCFPSRLFSQAASFPMSLGDSVPAMNRALSGEHGVRDQRDYRGREVIAAYGMIEALGLGLVQKIDAGEFYRPLLHQLWVAGLGLMLLIFGSAGVLYWRNRPLVHKLLHTDKRLVEAQRIAHIGSWEHDIESGERYWSEETYRIFGLEPASIPPEVAVVDQLVHPEDRERVRQNLFAAFKGTSSHELIFRIVLSNGQEKTVQSLAQLVCDTADRAVRLCGTVQDVSERQGVQNLLRKREEEFRALGENSPDLIIRFNEKLRCVYVNPVIVDVAGLQPADLLGKAPADMPIQPHIAKQWEASIRFVFMHRQTDIFEFSVDSGNRLRYYEVRLAPEFDGSGKVYKVLAVARDTSLIKETEIELRQLSAHTESVREEERRKIAREVHDELGQALTALRMDVSLMRLEIGDQHPRLQQRIESMTAGVDRTIEVVRHVTSTLRPAALDLGLAATLEWLAADFTRHSGIECVLYTPADEIELDDARATALFRIAQESLTNVLKHADASDVSVSLQLKEGIILLEICDDGCGFVVDAPRKAGCFGLMGMRERALILAGQIDITSSVGEGTCVLVRMPFPGLIANPASADSGKENDQNHHR